MTRLAVFDAVRRVGVVAGGAGCRAGEVLVQVVVRGAVLAADLEAVEAAEASRVASDRGSAAGASAA